MKTFRIFLFFALSLILVFWVVWKRNIFSKEVLKLEIIGPAEVEFGRENEFLVKYKNNGNFRLEEPELRVEFPRGTIFDGEILERKIFKDELGGSIYPGEERTLKLNLKFFGKEQQAKTLKAFLIYRPKNLKAKYVSETSFSFKIKPIPFTFELDLPNQVEPEKDFSLKILYFSNLDLPLENLLIKAEFPSGFEMIKSEPKAIEGKEWPISLLNSFEGGRVEVVGKIYGEIGERKIFKGEIGILVGGEYILLKEIERGIELIKPSIYLRQEINGHPEYVAALGEWLHYEIYFKNVGEEEMKNMFLIVQLEGEAFDFGTIKTETGNYQSGDNSIVFDWRKNQKLQLLEPMEEGKVEFWIKLKDEIGRGRNLEIKDKIFIAKIREEFSTKISTKLEFSQKGYFEDEIFGNSGPLPPRVGQITSYTLIWGIKNFYSELKNIKVKATLSERASLSGKIFPESEISRFSFDSQSREITWSIEQMRPEEEKSLAFQIYFLPQPEDRGQKPVLISEAKLTGKDTWSGKEIEIKADFLTTYLKDDPSLSEDKAIVQ